VLRAFRFNPSHRTRCGSGCESRHRLSENIGRRVPVSRAFRRAEYWIGSDPDCPVCRPDDPFCDPRHVRLFRGPRGGWHAEHNKTQNGLWLRMAQITADVVVHFQVGVQRFKLKVR
jgi:hypothetical protein